MTTTPDPRRVEAVRAAELLDPLEYTEVPPEGTGLPPVHERLTTDAIEKVNAGAQLAYALYHRDTDWWRDQPRSVMAAYARACAAYGIGKRGT